MSRGVAPELKGELPASVGVCICVGCDDAISNRCCRSCERGERVRSLATPSEARAGREEGMLQGSRKAGMEREEEREKGDGEGEGEGFGERGMRWRRVFASASANSRSLTRSTRSTSIFLCAEHWKKPHIFREQGCIEQGNSEGLVDPGPAPETNGRSAEGRDRGVLNVQPAVRGSRCGP